MKRFLVSAIVGIVACGCQPQQRLYWSKSDATIGQVIEDCRQCKETARGKAQAEHYHRYRQSIRDINAVPIASDEIERSNRDFDEMRFFGACMRSRGYQQVSEHRVGPEKRKASRFGGGEIQHLAGK
ncbi:MAG: hypothetical protein ACYSWO_11085 [Planctomycetota bacterium]|jgi:hypothetical protein